MYVTAITAFVLNKRYTPNCTICIGKVSFANANKGFEKAVNSFAWPSQLRYHYLAPDMTVHVF